MNKRKLLSTILAASMIFASMPMTIFAAEPEETVVETEFEFVNEDKTATKSNASKEGTAVLDYVEDFDEDVEDIEADAEKEAEEEIMTLSVDADDVWSIDNDGYKTLEEAIAAASDGDTIKLLCDDELESRVIIDGQELTLDLSGFTLSGCFTIEGGAKITVENGTIDEGSSYSWIYASGDDSNPTEFTLADTASIVADTYGLCICGVTGSSDYDGTGFVVTIDGIIEMNDDASAGIFIQGNMRTISAKVCDVIVNGFVIAGNEGVGMACNGWANVVINEDAYIEGGTGIEIRAGSLTVNGGTIIATNKKYGCLPNASGTTTDGVGIAIATHVTDNPISVIINDGEISGIYALAENNIQNVDNDVTIEIIGGTFIGSGWEDNKCAILIENYDDIDCNITGGDFLDANGNKSDISDYLAEGYTQDDDGEVEKAPCEHIYSDEDVTFEWSDDYESCTAIFICTVCGEEKEVDCAVASSFVVEPTCEDTGLADYTATAEIESYPYDGTNIVKADDTVEDVEVPALGHEWDDGIVTTEPTCTETGILTYTCKRCGATKTEEIAALGHDWSEWVVIKEATEIEDGEQERVCLRCGAIETETIPATGGSEPNPDDEPNPDYTEPGIAEEASLEIKITNKNGSYATGVQFEIFDEAGNSLGTFRQSSANVEIGVLPLGTYKLVIGTRNGYTFSTSEYEIELADNMVYTIASTNVRTSSSGGGGGSSSSSGSTYSNGSNGTWTYYDSIDKWTLNNFAYKSQWVYAYNPYADAAQEHYDWFHFDASGYMDTGWFTDVDGNIYYLNPSADNTRGKMMTGWQIIDGFYYYFNVNSDGTQGALYKNTVTPDGCLVNEYGQWVVNGVPMVG